MPASKWEPCVNCAHCRPHPVMDYWICYAISEYTPDAIDDPYNTDTYCKSFEYRSVTCPVEPAPQ